MNEELKNDEKKSTTHLKRPVLDSSSGMSFFQNQIQL